jgi:hypothetical protein
VLLQELRTLQTQLERSQLDKVRAERARDGVAAKLGRMLQAGNATLRSSLQSMENAQLQSPGHLPASNAAFAWYVEAAFAEAAAAREQPPCSKTLFGSPPRSPASARGSAAAADAVPSASSPAARSAASASPRGSAAAAGSSPRNGVSNTVSNNSGSGQGSRGSVSARDGRGSGVPLRGAASAPCSPHGKALARGLSIATHVGEQQGKDQ